MAVLIGSRAFVAIVAVSATVCAGCAIPEGRYLCTSQSDCPTGWSCRADSRCWSSPDPMGIDAAVVDSGSVDAGASDAGDAFETRDTGSLDARLHADAGLDAASEDAGASSDTPASFDAYVSPDSETMEDAFVLLDAFVPADVAAADAFVPPDVFVPADGFVSPDAFVPMDAFAPPDTGRDAFVPPDSPRDAYVVPDAYAPDAAPMTPCGLTSCDNTVAAASTHSCTIRGGRVYCWGLNQYLALGDGVGTHMTCSASRDCSNVPVILPASAFSDARRIEAGQQSTCAATASGVTRCWGADHTVAPGGAPFQPSGLPLTIPGLGAGTSLSIRFPFVVLNGSAAPAVIGEDVMGLGVYGDGTMSASFRASPTALTSLAGATSVEAGWWHVCAVRAGGGLSCWGRNSHGQLGDGTTTPRSTPVTATAAGSNVVSVALGDTASCALLTTGRVQCWGSTANGEHGNLLGTGAVRRNSSTFLENVVQLDAGYRFFCARTTTGNVFCWGRDDLGQIGNGAGGSTITCFDGAACVDRATQVMTITDAVDLACGGEHACVLRSNGQVWCWGDNGVGQLGDGTFTLRDAPVRTMLP